MKQLNILFPLLITMALYSCVVQHSAARYNDKIIEVQHEVAEEMSRFLKKFRSASIEDLKEHYKHLLLQTNKSIEKIKKMPGYEGDLQLRDGVLELLKFYKSSLENDYLQILTLVADKNRTPEATEKLRSFAQNLIKKEEEEDAKFAKIQEAFVAKHKLELVKHPIKE